MKQTQKNVETKLGTIDLAKIEDALRTTPTTAYTAPHDYPHGAPIFQESPEMEREKVVADFMRLYIHIPFCNYACSFCCYAKRVGIDTPTMKRYVDALKKELEWIPEGTPVSQFFMGGGTPTALPADLLDEILEAINTRMPKHGNNQHTVETSPESISAEHIRVLKNRGVGRVSMGIQSLQDEVLDVVRRKHSQELALDSMARIIDSDMILNIDLMYGLPGQTEESFYRDFELAAQRGVHSLTCYNLRLNEATSVAKQIDQHERFNLERLVRWRMFIRETAAEFGYTQTRWHTFRKDGSIAERHHRLPVADRDLRGYQLGIGMSARSSLGHTLYRNSNKLTTYMEMVERGKSPVAEHIPLGTEDLKTQYIARTLGDGKALSPVDYTEVFGTGFESDFATNLARLGDAGLVEKTGAGDFLLTESGRYVYDLIMLSFYPAHAQAWLKERLKKFQLIARSGEAA